ncbi:hypothetical protein CXF85_19795 [Colwellia sp. 75C3]|uniref:recombinase family protein n=1 Tax=Colwellia sp. 75C3 TaxID=888425 RepID=UPI000C329172|nr:recombinase family protein [Colwellia sp. 75C3]PKG81009.1 hypothetical protein CXF85_19795 [Colwellia sp. 75C3]
MSKPTLINYSRISTTKQTSGTGLAQQQDIEVMNQLSDKYQLEIDSRTFSDVGKSAFKGSHLENELGRLIALISSGDIEPGSIIVMFSLDRLSRQHLTSAVSLLLNIISKGVGIHTTIDNRLYVNDSDSLMADLMMSLIAFAVANEESVKKSTRTKGNAMKIINEHQSGKRSPDGFAFAVKSVGSHPWFINTSDGTVKPDSYYFPIAQEIAALLIDGLSPMKVKAIIDSKYDAKNTATWRIDLIRKLHVQGSLTGDRVLIMDDVTHTLKGYYPRLLSDVAAYQLVKIRESRAIPATESNRVSLLTGMSIFDCACCGGAAGSAINTKSVVSYFCRHARKKQATNGCTGWTVRADYIDKAIVNICADEIGKQANRIDNSQQIATIELDILTKKNKIAEFNTIALEVALTVSLAKSMATLEQQVKELDAALIEANAIAEIDTNSLSEQWDNIKDIPNQSDIAARVELKQMIRKSISHITVTKNDGYSCFTIEVNLINGQSRSVDCIKGKLSKTYSTGTIQHSIDGGYMKEVKTGMSDFIGSHVHEQLPVIDEL